MAAEIIIAPEAQQDLDEAYAQYEERRVGLGEDFLSSIDARVQQISRLPAASPVVYTNYRRAAVRKYPQVIFFEYANDTVTVYSAV